MQITISNEFRALQKEHLEQIKRQFLEEAFQNFPGEEWRFRFEDIDETCLVYPSGEFSIRGFYRYAHSDFRIHATYHGGKEPFVDVFLYSQVYSFHSITDAIAFCRNYRRKPTKGYAQIQKTVVDCFEAMIKKVIRFQMACVAPEDRSLLSVEGYYVSSDVYADLRWHDIFIEYSYKGARVRMASSFFPSVSEDENGVIEINSNFRMERPLSSLAEAIEFLKEKLASE